MMGSKAFESPLIPNARMRALYRGLVETRALVKSRTVDAALVATAIDLHAGDLTSLPHSTWLADHIRRLATREAPSRAQMSRTLRTRAAEKHSKVAALDRLLCAVGMAIALKPTQNVVIGRADGLTSSQWKHLLAVACEGELPLILVTSDELSAPPLIPVIPVDAGDVVALYRVAQETIVRARADGGIAVIRCVACGTDAIKLLAAQLIQKKICTSRWIASIGPSVRK